MQGTFLQIGLTEEDIVELRKKYHFSENDYEMLTHLYHTVEPIVKAEAFMTYHSFDTEIPYDNYVVVAVTLGKYVDGMQNIFLEAERVSEAYALDCIGLELLLKAYQKIEEAVHEETGLWLRGLEFLGDKYPLSMTLIILSHLGQQTICCNDASMMTPRKSTIFISELVTDKSIDQNACHICRNCGNLQCQNRVSEKQNEKVKKLDTKIQLEKEMQLGSDADSDKEIKLNYGYQRIFGIKNQTKDTDRSKE